MILKSVLRPETAGALAKPNSSPDFPADILPIATKLMKWAIFDCYTDSFSSKLSFFCVTDEVISDH